MGAATMNCVRDFENELQQVMTYCKDILDSYPTDLKKDALLMFDKYNVLTDGNNKTFICHLLPFWLNDAFKLDKETTKKMASGNIFGMFYFLIQDAIMDVKQGDYKGDLVPLGTLFYFNFFEMYKSIFPNNNIFWSQFRRYLDEWIYSVLWERRYHWIQNNTYDVSDLKYIASKSSPIKITCFAACILSGSLEKLTLLENIIDLVMFTLQMLDDWTDWKIDMENGQSSLFLTEVMKYNKCTFRELNNECVVKAVYYGEILDNILSILVENHSVIEKDIALNFPYLLGYHQMLLDSFKSIMNTLASDKRLRLDGGFIYWLNRINIK